MPKGTIVSVGEGETLLEKLLSGREFRDERCYVVGETKPRDRLIHEQRLGCADLEEALSAPVEAKEEQLVKT